MSGFKGNSRRKHFDFDQRKGGWFFFDINYGNSADSHRRSGENIAFETRGWFAGVRGGVGVVYFGMEAQIRSPEPLLDRLAFLVDLNMTILFVKWRVRR